MAETEVFMMQLITLIGAITAAIAALTALYKAITSAREMKNISQGIDGRLTQLIRTREEQARADAIIETKEAIKAGDALPLASSPPPRDPLPSPKPPEEKKT